MNDSEITALAREYAEEEARGTAVDALPDGFKENVIQRNANHFEKHLRWLLRRYCLVKKSKVEDVYKETKSYKSELEPFSRQSDCCEVKLRLLKSLFPDLGKEVEG